jgi:putative heme-binding domain-containing protein
MTPESKKKVGHRIDRLTVLKRATQPMQSCTKAVKTTEILIMKRSAVNWLAGITCLAAAWGVSAKQAKAPKPAAPTPTTEDLLKSVKAPQGFKVTVFAQPPAVNYPTCIAASVNGDVFVGVDQTGSLGHQPDAGWVFKCVDTTGSGQADKITKFAKMDHPRGLVWDHNKLYVLHPPFLTVYYDDNGSGVANRSEDLLTGISTESFVAQRGADHTTNGITMGIDGWIYIAVGDFGFTKCTGTDGKSLQQHGGGVARVRPDGTELEMVSINQRNIYGVGVDPLLNIFTRDNTNDGDGWDERFHHIVPLCNVGYPMLFLHFQEDLLPRLDDYGGGAPCGTTFIDEPGLPGDFGYSLYCCDWGRSKIYRQPMTPDGATFKVKQEEFVTIARPTQMVIDGQGRMYISSWRDGSFSYAGPNIGFVARLTAGDAQPPAPDLVKASDEELLKHLSSPSQVLRMAVQHEILRRGVKPAFISGLESLAAASDASLKARVAAIFTLKQLAPAESTPVLAKLSADAKVREFALRALADRKTQTANVPTAPFMQGLTDNDPRVRLHAINGLTRLNKLDAAPAILALTDDKDHVVAHVAGRSLIVMHAEDACLAAMEHSDSPSTFKGALNVLKWFHEPKVVNAVIDRLSKETDASARQSLLTVLCRLYFTEADWDGKWWGTRPTNNGPYYKWVTWSESDRIGKVLDDAFAKADPAMARYLVGEFFRHHLVTPPMMKRVAALAENDAAFRAQVVDLLTGSRTLSPETVTLLEKVAASPKAEPALRGKAIRTLAAADGRQSLEGTVRAFAAIGGDSTGELKNARESFLRDGKRAGELDYFKKLAASPEAAQREVAFGVLTVLANSNTAKPAIRQAAAAAVQQGWSNSTSEVSLLRAIGQTRFNAYADQVRSHLQDANADVKAAATYAATGLKLIQGGPAAAAKTMADIPYEEALATAPKLKGDVTVGQAMFLRQGCVACHTTSPNDPPKGPYLGDVGARFPVAELIESVLKPNAKIAQGFQTFYFELKNKDRKEGFITKEGGDEVEIRDITGASTTISLKDVVKRGKLDTSIMPEGIAANMTMQEFSSLLAYLQSLKGK